MVLAAPKRAAATRQINRIFAQALIVSRVARARVSDWLFLDLMPEPPADDCLDLLDRQQLDAAAAKLCELASPETHRGVQRVVEGLVAAVEELAAFVAEYRIGELVIPEAIARRLWDGGEDRSPIWTATVESLARLDGLRQRVRVRLIEADELFRQHPDPLSRLCAVAARVSEVVLPPPRAGVVGEWFQKLRKGDAAAA